MGPHYYDYYHQAFVYKFKTLLNKTSRTWKRYRVEVSILGETEKSYKIRFLQPTWRHKTGYTTWVRKKSVVIQEVANHTWNSKKEVIAGDINIFCQDLCVCSECRICPLRHYKDVGGRLKKKEK